MLETRVWLDRVSASSKQTLCENTETLSFQSFGKMSASGLVAPRVVPFDKLCQARLPARAHRATALQACAVSTFLTFLLSYDESMPT